MGVGGNGSWRFQKNRACRAAGAKRTEAVKEALVRGARADANPRQNLPDSSAAKRGVRSTPEGEERAFALACSGG